MTPAAARVLVVDDEPSMCWVVQSALQRDGHTVDVATSGPEALGLVRARPYDVVVMDFKLPGVDGTELVSLVRSIRAGARIIVISGWAAGDKPPIQDLLRQDTSMEFLAKPFLLADLRRRVKKALSAGTG